MIYIFIFYILPVILMWRYVHLNHSEGGKEEGFDVPIDSLYFVFLPILNIASNVLWILRYPKYLKVNSSRLNKFFRIKK